MAGPIALIAARMRMAKVTCPHCGHVKLVDKKPAAHRTCAKCHRQFADPLAAKKR